MFKAKIYVVSSIKGGFFMSKNQQGSYKRKSSKRQRKVKIVIYVMIVAMILSMATAGLSVFI